MVVLPYGSRRTNSYRSTYLRVSHIYYRVKMEEREILGKVRCSQESPEVV